MKYLLLVSWLTLLTYGQLNAQKKDPEQEKYEWRIRQEILYGTYIPKDINEVFVELSKKMDEASKNKFKKMKEEDAATKLFFSLGRWMTHNWFLYEGSRLSKYMQSIGIHHPDNMVRFFIIAYHRNLNKAPLEIKSLIQHFQQIENNEKQKRLKEATILKVEKRKKQK